MATITREQVYVERIQQLFNGTITAHESQINDEVVAIVDKMFLEITSCHRRRLLRLLLKPLLMHWRALSPMACAF